MNKRGPIIVIEDDVDDQQVLTMVFEELDYPNEVVFFSEGEHALEYLRQIEILPFLILCDINMPKVDGFDLKKMVQMDPDLHDKCIPFLFFTTSASRKAVDDAYKLSVQGFFVKPTQYEELKDTISVMIQYWQRCYSPAQMLQ